MWEMHSSMHSNVRVALHQCVLEKLVRMWADHWWEEADGELPPGQHPPEGDMEHLEAEARKLGVEALANDCYDWAIEQGDEEIGGGGFYVGRHRVDYATEDAVLAWYS